MRKSAVIFAAMLNTWKNPLISGLLATALLGTALPAAAVQKINEVRNRFHPVIDGDISEWIAKSPVPDLGQADFTSTFGELLGPVPESDQKVEVWLAWDEKTNLIYIAARVTDNFLGLTSISDLESAWQNDDIEVYIDADNSGGEYSSDNAHAQQYFLNPGGKVGVVLFPSVLAQPPQVQAAVKRSGTTYTYEMAIPGWDAMSADGKNGTRHNFRPGQIIGLTITFSDFETAAQADAGDYHLFNGLHGPVGAYHDANQFTDFQLNGLVISQTKAGRGLGSGRGKPVAVESSSWGEVKGSGSAGEEEEGK